MKKLVVLSGAGLSAESGLKTFRDAGGLWEGHRVEDVATPQAWRRDPEQVLRFYNERRRQATAALPNGAHRAIAALEQHFEVEVITQNVDDLHERAGSTRVLHLHGELSKARSTADERLVLRLKGTELHLGDLCELGSQLRPHIVWFGEEVPLIPLAAEKVSEADLIIIVGTSMVVYPAAGLIHYAKPEAMVYLIDPNPPQLTGRFKVEVIADKAVAGMEKLQKLLLAG